MRFAFFYVVVLIISTGLSVSAANNDTGSGSGDFSILPDSTDIMPASTMAPTMIAPTMDTNSSSSLPTITTVPMPSPTSTPSPTSELPTTSEPTTAPPTTQPSTTQPSTTQPSTTQPPTAPPTTQAPTTQAPTTEAPTTEASPTEPPTTEASPPTTDESTTDEAGSSAPAVIPIAVGSVLGVFAALIVVVAISVCCFFMFCRDGFGKGKKRSGDQRLLALALEETEGGVALRNFNVNTTLLYAHIQPGELVSLSPSELQAHVRTLHLGDGYAADEEYETAKDLDPPSSISYASQPCNEAKNRYINILASDHTRVMLSAIPKVAGSDYINANYVDGYNSAREYIASQGPLPHTLMDFWRMIWEQEISIIVMVTNPVEGGTAKCEEYWPSKGMMQCGVISITLEGEQLFPEFIVRRLSIVANIAKNKNQENNRRLVTQLHFTVWPDFGVPQEASAMLKFVRHVRGHVTPTQGPMLVHCSAGVGRTGTFIAIDILLQRMQEVGGVVNVQEVVCRMRAQRGNMVQTAAQYLFIYDALLYAYVHGPTQISTKNLQGHVTSLTAPYKDSGRSRLEKEFGHVTSVQLPPDHLFTIATERGNENKNRSQDSLPFDHNRVVLEELEGQEDSDYVNASYIDGYYNRVEFIATQHPLPNTTGDFWRMLLERSVNTWVVFGPLKDPQDRYWPEGDEKMEYEGGLTVQREEEEEDEEEVGGATEKDKKVIVRSFTLEMDEMMSSVTMFHVPEWCGEITAGNVPLIPTSDTTTDPNSTSDSTASPGLTPDLGTTPDAKNPTPDPTLDSTSAPKPTSDSTPTSAPKPTSDSTPTSDPKPTSDSTSTSDPKPTSDSTPTSDPKPTSDSTSAPITSGSAPTPDATSGSIPTPDATSGSTPTPDATFGSTPTPATTSGSTPAPDATSGSTPTPDATSGSTPTPDATSGSTPTPGTTSGSTPTPGTTSGSTPTPGTTSGSTPTPGTTSGSTPTPATTSGSTPTPATTSGSTPTPATTSGSTPTPDATSGSTPDATSDPTPTTAASPAPIPPSSLAPNPSVTLELIKQSRQYWRGTGFNPIAIHTATGLTEEVSGVYCGLCILLRQLEVEDAVDVVSTMEKIRQQRPSAITSQEYYRYLYSVLLASQK